MATYAKTTLNGSEAWESYATPGRYGVVISDMKSGSYINGISDKFIVLSSGAYVDNSIRLGNNNNKLYIAINIPGVTALTSWETWLSNNNTDLVYQLATPLIIPLTTTAINTYYGVNNFSADTGDISVSYRADIQLYIDKKIAEI